jgi:hypothetical protein
MAGRRGEETALSFSPRLSLPPGKREARDEAAGGGGGGGRGREEEGEHRLSRRDREGGIASSL